MGNGKAINRRFSVCCRAQCDCKRSRIAEGSPDWLRTVNCGCRRHIVAAWLLKVYCGCRWPGDCKRSIVTAKSTQCLHTALWLRMHTVAAYSTLWLQTAHCGCIRHIVAAYGIVQWLHTAHCGCIRTTVTTYAHCDCIQPIAVAYSTL